jgi:outer membrane protein, heavy metal efflux system
MLKLSESSLFLLSLCLTQSANAELSLENVLERALSFHPSILQEQRSLESKRADLFSSEGAFDPRLRAGTDQAVMGATTYRVHTFELTQATPLWGSRWSLGYERSDGPLPIYKLQDLTAEQGEAFVGLELPLLKDGWTDDKRTRIKVREKQTSAHQEALLLQKLEIQLKASESYWNWVSAKRKLDIAGELVKNAELRDAGIKERVRVGDFPAIERTDNQRLVVSRTSVVIAAERAFQKASLDLSLFLRNEQGEPLYPKALDCPSVFPEPSVVPALVTEMKHPLIQQLHWQSEEWLVQETYFKVQQLPKLDLKLKGTQPFGPYRYPEKLSALGTTKNPSLDLKVGLQFEMPLLLREARGKAQSATAKRIQIDAKAQLEVEKLSVLTKNSVQAVQAALKRLELARSELLMAQALERAEKMRTDQGDSSILILNIREQNTWEAANREVDALTEYFRSLAQYTYAAAKLPESESKGF